MNEHNHNLSNGFVVIFEGMDGTGKTTQMQRALTKLQQLQYSVTSHRNPGGTAIGEAIRNAMLAKLPRPPMSDLYMSLAVQEALIDVVNTDRAQSNVILLDRSPLSIAAYQIYGSGINAMLGWSHVQEGMDRLRPDLTILYKCTPDVALSRSKHGGQNIHDYFESKPLDYFKKVHEGYDEAAKRFNAVVIDATQSIDAIHEQTMQHIMSAIDKP